MADVGYHGKCYENFRSLGWDRLDSHVNKVASEKKSEPETFRTLCELVQSHVIYKKEIYSLASLKSAYESMKTDSCPILRVGDIRDKLLEIFPNEITVSCPSKHHNNTQYILPVGISLTSDITDAALHGGGIAKTALIRSAANHINEDIQKQK